jgi:sulfate adenylyltransferase subunit 2
LNVSRTLKTYQLFSGKSNMLKLMTTQTLESNVLADITSGQVGSLTLTLERLGILGLKVSERHLTRTLNTIFPPPPTQLSEAVNDSGARVVPAVAAAYEEHIRRSRTRIIFADLEDVAGHTILVVSDRRGHRVWRRVDDTSSKALEAAIAGISSTLASPATFLPIGRLTEHTAHLRLPDNLSLAPNLFPPKPYTPPPVVARSALATDQHAHLDLLEAESIRIIREAVAVAKKPGMLFSMGKDSMVMWTLAKKAFFPEPPPFPLVVIDTRWKFRDMYRFREYIASQAGVNLIVHINPNAIRDNVNPFDFGSAVHTDITKTQALKQVLDINQFDFVFGGARRDEEKSRAKERVFSLRNDKHGWDPKNQRPELWNVYNTRLMPGQSMRVFPLSNWTELDIWRYIEQENIDLVPLYFSAVRPFVERNGALIMVDDERFPMEPDETIHFDSIRFRTLGCYPLTGGVRSTATTVADIIKELEHSRVSERSSRVIDFDPGASMEQKKKEGYF